MRRRPQPLAVLLATALPALAAAEPVVPDPRVETLERLHDEAARDERRLMQGLLGGALVSAGAGAALLTRDGDDQAFRVAGGVTLGIAALETAVAAMILLQNGREQARWDAAQGERRASAAGFEGGVRHCLSEFARKKRGYRLMIGVDSAIILAGGAAAAVSQAGVEHGNRWLAAGLSVMLQGALLLVVDATGFVQSRRAEGAFGGLLVPTASIIGDERGLGATAGVAGVF